MWDDFLATVADQGAEEWPRPHVNTQYVSGRTILNIFSLLFAEDYHIMWEVNRMKAHCRPAPNCNGVTIGSRQGVTALPVHTFDEFCR